MRRFASELADALKTRRIPTRIVSEREFERRFVVPAAASVANRRPGMRIYTHPFKSKTICTPDCDTANHDGRILGCPRCWRGSKKWASIAAFGTHHTFDLVAKNRSGQTLAVEVKVVGGHGGRMPNGPLQTFLGQCSLAASKHDAVIGVCALRGRLNPKWRRDTKAVIRWCRDRRVHLVFRKLR